MSHDGKHPIIPLVFAAMAGVPGVITWSFAEHEARSFGSDWVLISTPLLLFATLCLAFAGKRTFGVVGFAAGLIVGLGTLAGLTYLLSASIDMRQAYQDERERLDATSALCDGAGQAFPEAPGFVPPARARMVVFTHTRGEFRRAYTADFRDWSPSPPGIDLTAVIACVDDVDTELEVCRYPGGRNMRRVQRDRRVRLFSLQTGAVVVDVALPGSQPDGCAAIEEFYADEGDNVKAGSTPGDDTVATFLRTYVTP